MSGLIDISPLISPRTAVWPGDLSFSREVALDMHEGANLTLSAIRSTVHIGAHADAPSHFHAQGRSIEAQDLAAYYGPVQVMRIRIPRGERILPCHLSEEIQAPRLLFETGSFPDPDAFNEDFNSLSPELIEHLADRDVVLVGLDTPSVDPFADAELRTHQALYRRDVANLEGLLLAHVKPGLYTLIALPLRLEGADASPVRAVLAPAQA